MLPSRGLRPYRMVPSASCRSLLIQSGASRKFSSALRKTGLSALPCRTSPFQSANWRAGTTSSPNVLLPTSSVRYGSWYAPWSWGRSSTASDATSTTISPHESAPELAPVPESIPEPVVASASPELSPAGIGQSAGVDGTSSAASSQTVEDLLGVDTASVSNATPLVDPSAPVAYWGQLKDMGLDYGWGPSTFFENVIELSYLHTELGWGGSILLSSLVLRCILFGFQVMGSDSGAKMAAMKPVLQPLMDEMEEAKRSGNDDKVTSLRMKQKAIMSEVGGDIRRSLATPVLQMALGFGAFRCLRGMTHLPVPGMSTEGWLWFTDLTVPDPLYVLPIVTGGLMYAIIKNGGETGMNTEVQQASFQKQLMVVMPVVMTAVTSFQPAGLQIYFFASAVLGGATSTLLRTASFRRAIGISQLPSKESNALYGKVIKGEIKLSALRDADGRIRYQAPGSPSPSSTSSKKTISRKKNMSTTASPAPSTSRLNLKAGITLPPHMRASASTKVPLNYADRDHDFEKGSKGGSYSEKWDWIQRNYRPMFVWRRVKRLLMSDSRTVSVMMEQDRKKKAQEASRRYELERKRRLEGR